MKNISIVLVVVLILSFIIFFIVNKDQKKLEKINVEYPLLKKTDYLSGYVISNFNYSENHLRDPLSVSRVLVDDKKLKIVADEIHGLSNLGINEIIEIGDYIFKKESSDTIIISKKNNERHVLLRRDKLFD